MCRWAPSSGLNLRHPPVSGWPGLCLEGQPEAPSAKCVASAVCPQAALLLGAKHAGWLGSLYLGQSYGCFRQGLPRQPFGQLPLGSVGGRKQSRCLGGMGAPGEVWFRTTLLGAPVLPQPDRTKLIGCLGFPTACVRSKHGTLHAVECIDCWPVRSSSFLPGFGE